MKKGQASFEYLIIMGFVTLIITGILWVAISYASGVQGRIITNQINEFSESITTTAESVFYTGEPTKITIETYLPEGVEDITITENMLSITYNGDNGLTRTNYESNVNITGTINESWGIKRIKIEAIGEQVHITQE